MNACHDVNANFVLGRLGLTKRGVIEEYLGAMPRHAPLIETANLQDYEKAIADCLADLARRKVISRIWKKDWTVWQDDPGEVRNRLGWLTSPRAMGKRLGGIKLYARRIREKGYTQALLLGMGGSSLAPLVLSDVFKTPAGFLDLGILDLTDPAAVLGWQRRLDPAKTLFIVSSKSGTTVETSSFFRYFWNWASDRLGVKKTGGHFAAITDPGTPLEEEARRLGFGAIFAGDPEIGGRFSALSPFCLVPAALKGIRVESLLEAAVAMSVQCRREPDLMTNPGALLGTILGVLADKGRDKLTFLLSPRFRSFGLWLEQLIAESTGKEGKGILPVNGESAGAGNAYGDDRVFVRIKEEGETAGEAAARHLETAGFPLLSLIVPGPSHLGSQFFLWEFATAVAGYFLGINPFDQPDVDSAKKKTQEFVRYYLEHGSLPEEKPLHRRGGISLYSDFSAPSFGRSLERFLSSAAPGDYLAVQAFLAPTRETDAALQKLRHRFRDRTQLATTVGYGPRFLHSTGQLHKGDRGNGLFIQITADDRHDAAIPDSPGDAGSSLSFGLLKAAQARGDFEALKSRGRRIIRFHLGKDAAAGLERLLSFPPLLYPPPRGGKR
jgi:glucose-6-phosphate isomerase/transaldolase/glucose-6-phosphate isomerase